MPIIKLTTEINSSLQICFDLSRSIDLHIVSTAKTKEKAVAGRTKGLINLNETVTWQAVHFGVKQKLTTKITVFDRPNYFVDEQVKGIFKSMIHQHSFKIVEGKVIMKDVFQFHSPLGFVGQLFNRIILTSYLKKFLIDRNKLIKEFAETDTWRELLIDG